VTEIPGQPESFKLCVGDGAVLDLRERLQRTRWPDEPPGIAPWKTGTDLAYLKELVAYWLNGFDWRAQERRFNEMRQQKVEVGGFKLHLVHEEGRGPRPLPLVLSHGWPGSVWEFHRLIPLLTDPERFGADPADAFTVVAPSLPGYTLSYEPGQPRLGALAMGDVFAELMAQLGYHRYGVQGGDWGAFISAGMGLRHAERVVGAHLNLLPLRREPPEQVTSETEEMRAYQAELAHWVREETGYSAIQGTKPQTVAYGLTDSPAGLAAWVLEKFRGWSDCEGDLDRCFTKDDLLTNVMLYWCTGAIGSSFSPYYARAHEEPWPLPGERRVEMSTGYISFPKDILHPPRAVAEQAFNIQHWTVEERGGHFAALEQPEALAADIRAFFRPLR